MKHVLEVVGGIGVSRPQGESSLVEAVELVRSAVENCRRKKLPKLLFNATGLTGVSIPTLVDRFLAVEEWAQEAEGLVSVALVVHPEYIHPHKFGVVVAAHFGLQADVFTNETEAFDWFASVSD